MSRVDGGTPRDVIQRLRLRVSGYLASNPGEYYIGFTSDPEVRCRRQHDNDGRWHRLVGLYGSDSHKDAVEVELALISFAMDSNHRNPANVRLGGEGAKAGYREYFVYILLQS